MTSDTGGYNRHCFYHTDWGLERFKETNNYIYLYWIHAGTALPFHKGSSVYLISCTTSQQLMSHTPVGQHTCTPHATPQPRVTAQLISAFVFATRIVQSLFFQNSKLLACFCDCIGGIVSEMSETRNVGFLMQRLNFHHKWLSHINYMSNVSSKQVKKKEKKISLQLDIPGRSLIKVSKIIRYTQVKYKYR